MRTLQKSLHRQVLIQGPVPDQDLVPTADLQAEREIEKRGKETEKRGMKERRRDAMIKTEKANLMFVNCLCKENVRNLKGNVFSLMMLSLHR